MVEVDGSGMAGIQLYLLGIMTALAPSMVVLAVMLRRAPTIERKE